MATVGVVFNVIVQEPQEISGVEEHMVATLHYALTCDGEYVGDFSSRVKQTQGSDLESGSIEVEPPEGYDGPFSHLKFAQLAEDYCRDVIGPSGSGVRVRGGASTAFSGNVYRQSYSAQFTAEGDCHVVHG
jgi:hypothetical protein